jgi:tRNA pseudouridine38-40 synthase
MVRIIAGTLMVVGMGKIEPSYVAEIIAGCDRTKAGQTAEPQGLTLVEIFYE